MNVLETLKTGRQLISIPSRWTQEAGARDACGEPVMVQCCSAVCFCSIGAIGKLRSTPWCDEDEAAINALDATVQSISSLGSIMHYNDTHSHAEVIAVWDETIVRLEGQL